MAWAIITLFVCYNESISSSECNEQNILIEVTHNTKIRHMLIKQARCVIYGSQQRSGANYKGAASTRNDTGAPLEADQSAGGLFFEGNCLKSSPVFVSPQKGKLILFVFSYFYIFR